MKKLFVLGIILGLTLILAPVAKAEYAVSFSVGSYAHLRPEHYNYSGRHRPANHGRFNHGYSVWPRPVISNTRVITVYKTAPKEILVRTQERLGISDVIVLSKAGVNDDILINKIAKSGSVFDLTVEEVEALRREGVSSRVVNFMLDTKK